jgi:hypothetical protein
LTFRGKHNNEYAEEKVVEWVRSIYKIDRIRVGVMGVVQSRNTQTHAHLLLIPANADAQALIECLGAYWETRWKHGISSVELIRNREDASRYVQGHMSMDTPDEWSFVYYNKRLLRKLRAKAGKNDIKV